jgi:ribonucleoside-triphosphate reductase
MKVIKRDSTIVNFDINKIFKAVKSAYKSQGLKATDAVIQELAYVFTRDMGDTITVEQVQDEVEKILMDLAPYKVARAYILYREQHSNIREQVNKKQNFINKYKEANNTADATVDDNSNVRGKNVGILNAEINKADNILINRGMVMTKLKELFPEFDAKQYSKDLENHIIYKHDESSSNSGATMPYCCSISLYPFITDGLKNIGGLSAAPKNIDSFCGMYCNLIFSVAGQFLGAVATSEFLLYFDYYARKEWGDSYYTKADVQLNNAHSLRYKSIRTQIHQYFQQVVYTINQSAANRGMQSAFTNFSYFDESFFHGMFDNFCFPDGSKPIWESLQWLQEEFMTWFNKERLKVMLTYPVESVTLLYKDGKFQDERMYNFVCKEYAEGHSFFTYISDTVDSLSSCCRLKNKIQTKEFNFTNGNMGIMTGSKSVISLNLNRIIQDCVNSNNSNIKEYLINILDRVYKYHIAYNELLYDMYNANLLPVYKAGFIHLDKQYLTIGIIGLTAAAEFLGIEVSDNEEYRDFCQLIFSTIKEQNTLHKTKKETYNTECVPAESAGLKLYNYDKEDGYFVPKDINLYTSYMFKPYDFNTSVLERIILHGNNYIGDYLDGGSSCHINLEEHLSEEQYKKIILFAADNGCQYFTFNIPNSECEDCGYITKHPINECPKCGSNNISLWDRVIGYLTKIKNWSTGRQIEQKTRVYSKAKDVTVGI